MLRQLSEAILVIAGFALSASFFTAEFNSIYPSYYVAIVGACIFLVGLFLAFPLNRDFNRALAYSIGNTSQYFMLAVLVLLVGFSINGKINILSLASIGYLALLLVAFIVAVLCKARGRVW